MEDKKIIEEYEKKLRKTKKQKNTIIIILIIIIMFLLCLLGYRIGKIGYQETSSNAEETIGEIKITENDIDITKLNKLNIFNNVKYDNQKIIAPKSKGAYKFCVKNESNKDIEYNIKFADEMSDFVNMKYRLKMDNIYIKGTEEKYISIEDLNVNDITVLKDSINIYTLEWYWEDDDELDTYVGTTGKDEYYTLNLEITSSPYIK